MCMYAQKHGLVVKIGMVPYYHIYVYLQRYHTDDFQSYIGENAREFP